MKTSDVKITATASLLGAAILWMISALPALSGPVHDTVARFKHDRTRQLIAHQPDLTRLLRGGHNASLDATVTGRHGKLTFLGKPGARVWSHLRASWTTAGRNRSGYALGAIGTHRNLRENLAFGAMFQFDRAFQRNGDPRARGAGWLIGPYAVAKSPRHPLYFSSRLLFGNASDSITGSDSGTNGFRTARWLAEVKMIGEMTLGPTTLTPNLRASFAEGRTGPTFFGQDIGTFSQRVRRGEVAFGADFARPVPVRRGSLDLSGGISGIWSHRGRSGPGDPGDTRDRGRARTEIAVKRVTKEGNRISAAAFYDGIGDDRYESYGLEIGFDMRF